MGPDLLDGSLVLMELVAVHAGQAEAPQADADWASDSIVLGAAASAGHPPEELQRHDAADVVGGAAVQSAAE